MQDRKWALIARVLGRTGLALDEGRVLDLGSGDRGDGVRLAHIGIAAARIVAFDLNPVYARRVRNANRGIHAVSGDAVSLPFRDGSFRIVYQSTMLSSVIDMALRREILREIARVLAPGGAFISYDVRYRNPWNPNTRPLKAAQLSKAFEGWPLTIRSVTGIPQVVRLVAWVSIAACRLIESVPLLRSHLLVIAIKP